MAVIKAIYAPTLVPKTALGAANGVAQLGPDKIVLAAQLPSGSVFTRTKERYALTATDITNGYKDLAHLAVTNSMTAGLQGLGLLEESLDGGTTGDYTLATNNGVTRLTWKNDFASGGAAALAAGAELFLHYSY